MGKQGLRDISNNPFLYQETVNNASSAVGHDESDNDIFKVVVSTAVDANPDGTSQIEVDPATNDVTLPAGDLLLTELNMANQGISKIRLAPAVPGQDLMEIYFWLNNIFIGANTGNQTGTGLFNLSIGNDSLQSFTTGTQNIAVGQGAPLSSVTTGQDNMAIGFAALNDLTTGSSNTAIGSSAMGGLGTQITSGSRNCAIGNMAGSSLTTTDSDNICIHNIGVAGDTTTLRVGAGTGTGNFQLNRTFIHGIRGITTGNADAINVLIDSAGQLGTVSSSIRYKENIEQMNSYSSPVMDLNPVTFTYKEGLGKVCSGLIAEEVEDIFPDLVAYNDEGEPESVKYHELPVLLLNEIQKMNSHIRRLEDEIKTLKKKR